MIKHFILVSAIFWCSALTTAETLEQPHVAVYGTAEIKITPNEMSWSVNVKNEDKELPMVATQHTATVAKVLEFLKSQKINEDKLQTSRMHFGENWEYTRNKHVKIGYYASTDISFTITDFDLYQKLWFGLAGIDGVSVQNTQYAHSDRIRYQNESRQ